MRTNRTARWVFAVLLFVVFIGSGYGFCQDMVDGALDPDKVSDQKLGDYIWGPRIAKADIMGKVIACFPYSGTDRSAGAIPNMLANKVRSRNMVIFMVLVDNEELPMALRLASAGKIKTPIVGIRSDDLKKLLPGLSLEKPSNNRGGGRRGGGRQGRQGSYATMAVVRTPDGSNAFSGKAERQQINAIMEAAAQAAAKFPVPVAVEGDFSKMTSSIRKLASSGNYGSVVRTLVRDAESDDATEAAQAKALLANIKAYGQAFLAKGAYFEDHYPLAAQEAYTWLSKSFKGLPVADAADDRLKKMKDQSSFKDEAAACKLADTIRGQCALLMSPKPDAQMDLTDQDFLQFNKKNVGGLLRNVALFKKRYMETKVASELAQLLSAYNMTL